MTESDLKLVDGKFYHLIVEGADYEIGTQLADYVKGRPDGAEAKKVYTSGKLDLKKTGFKDFPSLMSHLGKYAPGVVDEIQGFADRLDSSPEKVPFLTWTIMSASKGNCSQLAALSPITDNQHIYAARTYEWTTEEDLVLCTTRRKGKASHIGFTSSLHGRYDGLNEHGLFVSMTGAGIFNVPLKSSGFFCCVAIREVLESCRSVGEGLDLLRTFPLGGHFNLILADKNDHAAVVEFADGDVEVQETSATDSEPYVYSVNHYKLPTIEKHNELNCGIISHSKMRQELITKTVEEQLP
ncbi:MAG: C45 family autoproteolytic acyltransferase/hydrolase, partial [Candidatus Thorarchaeota archaeon]